MKVFEIKLNGTLERVMVAATCLRSDDRQTLTFLDEGGAQLWTARAKGREVRVRT